MDSLEVLLEKIRESFFAYYEKDRRITGLFNKIRDGTATYVEAHEFAVRVGNDLAKAYKINLEPKLMEYEEAMTLLQDPLRGNYDLISKYCEEVQSILNQKYGLGIKSVLPDFSIDRVEGLAKAISEATTEDAAMELFGEQIINFSQSIVDNSVRKNAELASKLGFSPQIVREYEGKHFERKKLVDCQWCKSLSGTFDYQAVRASGSDVYKRHESCRCVVTYIPDKGQNIKMRSRGNAFTRF